MWAYTDRFLIRTVAVDVRSSPLTGPCRTGTSPTHRRGLPRSLVERDVRPVDVPLVDAVDLARLTVDLPAGGLGVPSLSATAQLALARMRRGDGRAHTRPMGTVLQKDTARSPVVVLDRPTLRA